MALFLLISICILSIMYAFRIIKVKFKYENRKEINVLQIIIYSLAIIELLTGMWILFIPMLILMIGLAICPEKYFNFIKIWIDKLLDK